MAATMGGGGSDSSSEGEAGEGTAVRSESTAASTARRRGRRPGSRGSSTSASLPSKSAMVAAADDADAVASSSVFTKPLARLAAGSNVGRSLKDFRDGRGPIPNLAMTDLLDGTKRRLRDLLSYTLVVVEFYLATQSPRRTFPVVSVDA